LKIEKPLLGQRSGVSRMSLVFEVATWHSLQLDEIPKKGQKLKIERSLMAEAEYFFKIDGIPGESLDARHPDEIDVLSWSWSETQVPGPVGGEGESGKVKMEDVNFVVLV
jgi:Type VI secretion system effector, Hcp